MDENNQPKRLLIIFVGSLYHLDRGDGVEVFFPASEHHDYFLAASETEFHHITQPEDFRLECAPQGRTARLHAGMLPLLPFVEGSQIDQQYVFAHLLVPQPRHVHVLGPVIDADDLFEGGHVQHLPAPPRRFVAMHAFEYWTDPNAIRLTGDWEWSPAGYAFDNIVTLYVVGRPHGQPHDVPEAFNDMMRLVPNCDLRMRQGSRLRTPDGAPADVQLAGFVPLYTGSECIGAGTVAPV
jgi:hypothetical protein